MLIIIAITVINIIVAVLMLKAEYKTMISGLKYNPVKLGISNLRWNKVPIITMSFNPLFWKPLFCFWGDVLVTLTCGALFGGGLYAGMLSIMTSNILSFFVFLDKNRQFRIN